MDSREAASVEQQHAGNLSFQLHKLQKLLEERLPEGEQVVDFDVPYVFNFIAAGVINIVVPRTLKHVEITLSAEVAAPNFVAVLFGNNQQAQCAQLFAATGQVDPCAVVSPGGQVKVRSYTDGSGYITVYAPAAAVGTMRLRSLDLAGRRKQPDDIAGDLV